MVGELHDTYNCKVYAVISAAAAEAIRRNSW